jgi:serine/threonine protein kinase
LTLVGSTLGKYQVLEELGRGGMAVVYKGYNPALQRTVALKVLPEELAADQEFVERFRREAQTAAQLKYPNIATIYDVEQEGDLHFIVMEYLPGHTLQQEIQLRGAPPLKQTVEIIHALADALDYAHQRGLTHRDVKPSNVMLGPEGHVTLMDFGIVKAAAGIRLTQEGMRIGTPEYMSPEQAQGRKIDCRSDIYSLGIVLYEMLVGQVPFRSTSSHKVLQDHVHREPPPPSQFVSDLPPGVEKTVLRALAKHPGQRFQTAGQMAAALEQAALPRPVPPEPRRRESEFKLIAADGREFYLERVIGLGRSTDNHVVISDNKISRHHAQIRCEGARCQIIDLGSVNGTFLNGDLLRPNVPYPLQPGDHLRLGPGFLYTIGVETAVEPLDKQPAGGFPGSGWRRRLWADRRSRTIVLLTGAIGLLLIVTCLIAFLVTGLHLPSSRGATPEGGWAQLAVLNATGYALTLTIGEYEWDLDVDQRRVLRFPPGRYHYAITFSSGETVYKDAVWEAGDNGELQLLAGSK